MTDTTRDAFEAWARYLDISTEKDGWQGLRYTHSHVQAMWEGWQAATLAAKRQPQWLPIQTAPKNACILLWIDIVIGHPLVMQGCWFNDDHADEKGWIDLEGELILYATHWMPLPASPQGNP